MHAPKYKPRQSIDIQCCSLSKQHNHIEKIITGEVDIRPVSCSCKGNVKPTYYGQHGIVRVPVSTRIHNTNCGCVVIQYGKRLATTTILRRACFKRDAAEFLTNSNSPGRIASSPNGCLQTEQRSTSSVQCYVCSQGLSVGSPG